jgi:hypothetical protein
VRAEGFPLPIHHGQGGVRLAVLAATVALSLTGCDPGPAPEAVLRSCLASTEQTILLRQLALSGTEKEKFESCKNRPIPTYVRPGTLSTINYCRVVYLDANDPVRQCMSERGYIFLDLSSYGHFKGYLTADSRVKPGLTVCDLEQYQQASCYYDSLMFKLRSWWEKGAQQP